MEAEEATYTQIAAAIAADTGGTGLNNSASNAHVRWVWRNGGPEDRYSRGWPQIVVVINAKERNGAVVSSGCEMFDQVVSFMVETDRDAGLATQDRVQARIRAVFNNTTLSNLVDTDAGSRTWRFAPMGRLTPSQQVVGSGANKRTRIICPYRLVATKGAT